MDHPRNDLLARTGGSGDHHPRSGRRHPLYLRSQLGDQRRVTGQGRFRAGPQAQFDVFPRQRRGFQRPAHHQQQTVGLKRLFNEIVSALLDRSNSHFDGAMTRDHDDGYVGFVAVQRLQDADPIHAGALQPHIQDHQRRPSGAEGSDRRFGIAGATGFIALVAQDALDQQPDVRLIVNDQDFMRHVSPVSFPRSPAPPRSGAAMSGWPLPRVRPADRRASGFPRGLP